MNAASQDDEIYLRVRVRSDLRKTAGPPPFQTATNVGWLLHPVAVTIALDGVEGYIPAAVDARSW